MKPTHPILKEGYVPSWMQRPDYLARKFAKVRREQASEEKKRQESLDKIIKIRRA